MRKPPKHQDGAIRRVAVLAGRGARASLKEALKALPTMLDMDKARELLRSGRAQDVVSAAIDWHHFRQIIRHPFERLARGYEAGAALGERKINGAFAARQRAVRFRKGGPGSADGNVSLGRKPEQEDARGGPGADPDVTECLQLLKRESSVATWPKE